MRLKEIISRTQTLQSSEAPAALCQSLVVTLWVCVYVSPPISSQQAPPSHNRPRPVTTSPAHRRLSYKEPTVCSSLCSAAQGAGGGRGWRCVPCSEEKIRKFRLLANLVRVFLLLVLQLGKQSHYAARKIISVMYTSDGFVDCKIKGGFGIREPDLGSSASEAVNAGWCFSWKAEIFELASNNKRA